MAWKFWYFLLSLSLVDTVVAVGTSEAETEDPVAVTSKVWTAVRVLDTVAV